MDVSDSPKEMGYAWHYGSKGSPVLMQILNYSLVKPFVFKGTKFSVCLCQYIQITLRQEAIQLFLFTIYTQFVSS